MTTENNSTESTTQTVDAGTKSEVITLEAALDKIKTLESNFQEAVSTRDKAKEKLRKLESDFGQTSEIQSKYDELFAEKSKLHEQFESISSEYNTYKDSIKQEKVNGILNTALEKAGAKSTSTVLKLLDKSKIEFDEQGNVKDTSIDSLVNEIKTSDPFLFSEVFIDPGVKRAGEGSSEGIFDKEIRACKTQHEVESVLRKYGKL